MVDEFGYERSADFPDGSSVGRAAASPWKS